VPGSDDGCDDCVVFHFEQSLPFFDENGVFITETSGLDAERYFEEMDAREFDLIADQVPEQTIPTQNQD